MFIWNFRKLFTFNSSNLGAQTRLFGAGKPPQTHKLQTLQVAIILARPDYENNPELRPHLHRSCRGYWILRDLHVYFIISLLMVEKL